MARRETYQANALIEFWTNGTQAGEPTSGYYNGAGARQRALTQAESAQLAADDASNTTVANLATLQAKADQALTANAIFQAVASPSNAQIAAQVQALTKQCNGIIRLLRNALDSTSGT